MAEEQITEEEEIEQAAAAKLEAGEEEEILEEEEDEDMVPKAALLSERGKRQDLESQITLYKNQLNLATQNQTKEKDPFDELDDEEIITKRDHVRTINKIKEEFGEQVGQLMMEQKYPGFEEVIKTYLKPMIDNEPELYNMIMAVPKSQQTALAYRLAKSNPDFQEPGAGKSKAELIKEKSDKLIKNSKKVKSPSTGVGGAGGVGNKYEEMSEEDIIKDALTIIEKI